MGLALNSCAASGPLVTECIVDYANHGFQCVTYPDTKSFKTFDQGKDLKCASPLDTENALKSCKNHVVLPITLCSYSPQGLDFLCIDPEGHQYYLAASDADNYACLSSQDLERLEQRCK